MATLPPRTRASRSIEDAGPAAGAGGVGRHLLPAGEVLGEAAGEDHHRQGDDEGLEPEARDERARGGARREADGQHRGDGDEGPPAERDGEQREAHRREREDAAHREVDAAREDDQRHAAREGALDGDLAEHVAVRAPAEEHALLVEDGAERRASPRARGARGRGGSRRGGPSSTGFLQKLRGGASHSRNSESIRFFSPGSSLRSTARHGLPWTSRYRASRQRCTRSGSARHTSTKSRWEGASSRRLASG